MWRNIKGGQRTEEEGERDGGRRKWKSTPLMLCLTSRNAPLLQIQHKSL